MSLIVVGSFALDTIRMPDGRLYKDILGGSGIYFALAAATLAPEVAVVGAVGGDFPFPKLRMLRNQGVQTDGLVKVADGKTFRWEGTYQANMDDRVTDNLQLGVLASHTPQLSDEHRNAAHVFLACAMPSLQLATLRQMKRKPLAVCDTIQVYIENDRPELLKVIKSCGGIIINDSEARLLLGDENMVRCAKALCRMGPRFAVVKKGANGALLAIRERAQTAVYPLPAWPLAKVADPTGAGDSFAGGFMGWLAKTGKADAATLRQAAVHGTAVASFTCEGVGPSRLARLSANEVTERAHQFAALLNCR